MKAPLTELLVNESEIQKTLRSRRKTVIEQTVSGSNIENARKKAEIEKDEGWEPIRENTRSIRMAKDKPIDEQLEDEVWCTLATMGFDEMSPDRQFKIHQKTGDAYRQIDVFAKDSETYLLVECTTSENPKKKSMTKLIEKITSFRHDIFNSVKCHYENQEKKLKGRFIIATRNIEWSKTDLQRAEHAKICVLREQELDYYRILAGKLKRAAKYQLLANVFSGEKIAGLEIAVPATRGTMGGTTFYNFLISPRQLLKIAYVSHKSSKNIDNIDTYQRMLQPSRLKRIANYVDNGGQFPTNIVINIKDQSKLRFDKIKNSSFGTLYLPKKYACAWVIDGQHRLYGYAHSQRSKLGEKDKTAFPVLAYERLSPSKEADLFVDINCEQVRVSRNLLNEIYANLNWDSENFDEFLQALCSRVCIRLNDMPTSPVKDRLVTTSRQKSHYRCLTLTTVVDCFKKNKMFGEEKKSGRVNGPLTASYSEDREETMEKAVKVTTHFLDQFAQGCRGNWELGDSKNEDLCGFLCTNNGLRALFVVLKETLHHMGRTSGRGADDFKPEETFPYIDKYTKPLVDFFKDAAVESIARLRSRIGEKGVSQNAMELHRIIHNAYSEYKPDGLEEYLESIDEEGTKEARSMVEELQRVMYDFVVHKLKEEFGEERKKWWYEGVPEKVRIECVKRQQKEKGAKDEIQYLNPIDYHSIAHKNWKLFEPYFTIDKDGGKEKKLGWLKEFSRIRNITNHPEKWPAKKDEVEFIRKVHNHVMNVFIIDDE